MKLKLFDGGLKRFGCYFDKAERINVDVTNVSNKKGSRK